MEKLPNHPSLVSRPYREPNNRDQRTKGPEAGPPPHFSIILSRQNTSEEDEAQGNKR
jgi:hypothetical protein